MTPEEFTAARHALALSEEHLAAAPADADNFARHMDLAEEHTATCPACTARERYEAEHLPPLPPMPTPGWLPLVSWVQRVPTWARPAAVGAVILAAIVSLRGVFMLPRLLDSPALPGGLLLAIVAAAGAGAGGGFAYSLTRPTLRRLGRPGDYLTGIVCVLAYMGALALVAPIAFGAPVIEGPGALPVFIGVSVFFGLFIGHTWFREARAPEPPGDKG